MRVVAIASQKGGSGKTTTAVNLAAALGEQGQRVLLLDLDPQASSSSWLRTEAAGRGLLETFVDGKPLADLVQVSATPGIALVPGSRWLAGLDRLLANEIGAETLLRREIQQLPPQWDCLLMDCPPSLGLIVVNALAAANDVLVPVEAHVLPLNGLVQLLESIDRVRERINPHLALSGILACRVAPTRHCRDVVRLLRERFGTLVFDTVVRQNTRLAECPSFGEPIMSYAPHSAGTEDYRALAAEWLVRARRKPDGPTATDD